ncbi:hypothetical protein ATCC90586_001268 [Pythium insidiosum]|nr:hypothetical protein ATCC90586_001268 [Pythium insidiosum]
MVAVARAQREPVWVHIDGAYGGAAAICPELRYWLDGVELVDSLCINPHKWLMVAMDCSLLWVRDRRPLIQALALDPEYLKSDFMSQTNYKDWQVALGRRFRSLKLWFTLRRFGAEGLRAHIRRSIELTRRAESLLLQDGRFTIFTPVRMALVCFYVSFGGRELNEALLRRVNDTGKIFLIHSVVDGTYFLRLTPGGSEIDEWHIDNAVTSRQFLVVWCFAVVFHVGYAVAYGVELYQYVYFLPESVTELRLTYHGLLSGWKAFFTIDGKYFELGTDVRAIIEIVTQILAIRRIGRAMKTLWLHDLTVGALVLNCWSTPLLRFIWRHEPVKWRFVRLFVGSVIAACFLVVVQLRLAWDVTRLDNSFRGFDVARNTEYRYATELYFVSDWLTTVSTRVAAVSAILTLGTIRSKVLARARRRGSVIVPIVGDRATTFDAAPHVSSLVSHDSPAHRVSNAVFLLLGVAILVTHVFITMRNSAVAGARCIVRVRNGVSTRLPCAALEINCYRLGSAGAADDITKVLQHFDFDVLSALRIAHCPALEGV